MGRYYIAGVMVSFFASPPRCCISSNNRNACFCLKFSRSMMLLTRLGHLIEEDGITYLARIRRIDPDH